MELSFITLHNLLLWLAAWNVVGFAMMGWDKYLALSQGGMKHPDRISEKTFHEIALVGGFLGVILGGQVFHHKVSKTAFWGAVAVGIVLWGFVSYLVGFGGLPY